MKIILASQSPRRKQLLEWAEVNFEIIVKPTDETWAEGMPVDQIPIHIAQQKADAITSMEGFNDETPVLAADTVVVLGDEIIGKPSSREEAIAILSKLSGRKHEVITGVVIRNKHKEIRFADITHVWFHTLTQEQISFYVDKYKPYDKAGAYAIQEWIGVTGIQRIDGDFYNVMGLPVSRVIQALDHFKS